MAKIRLAAIAPPIPAAGVPTTSKVFAGLRDPIHLHQHQLPAATTLTLPRTATGHLAYVWDGTVSAGNIDLPHGSMIAVEHAAKATLKAGTQGATLLVFNRAAATPAPGRPGGHVHLLPADRVPRTHRLTDSANYGAAIYADAACPTCELWLHESNFHDPDLEVARHFHTEDEIIVVTAGQIVLGKRCYGRGAALAVARNTIYGFHTGPAGLSFINFRPSHPTYATPGQARIIDEQALYVEKLGHPHYLEPA